MRPLLTQDALKKAVHYDPETGVFTRLIDMHTSRAGSQAGTADGSGYLRFRLYGQKHRAHRLAFLYMTGEHPKGEVDHINGARSDNRWSNLRDGDRFQNQQNQRQKNTKNTTGLMGASQHHGKFMAQIRHNGTTKYLGVYKTAEEAHQVYIAAKRQLHAGCTI